MKHPFFYLFWLALVWSLFCQILRWWLLLASWSHLIGVLLSILSVCAMHIFKDKAHKLQIDGYCFLMHSVSQPVCFDEELRAVILEVITESLHFVCVRQSLCGWFQSCLCSQWCFMTSYFLPRSLCCAHSSHQPQLPVFSLGLVCWIEFIGLFISWKVFLYPSIMTHSFCCQCYSSLAIIVF